MKIVIARVIGNDFAWTSDARTQHLDIFRQTLEYDASNLDSTIAHLLVLNRIVHQPHSEELQQVFTDKYTDDSSVRYEIAFDEDKFCEAATNRALYLTNLNAARNEALEIAFDVMKADYVLVLDYRCFLTIGDTQRLVQNLSTQPDMSHYVCSQGVVLNGEDSELSTQQMWWRGWDELRSMNVDSLRPYYIIFGKQGYKHGPGYNEDILIGSGTTTELLSTLGVSGPWMAHHQATRPCPTYMNYGRGTTVRVLSTGDSDFDPHLRHKMQQYSIKKSIQDCDELLRLT